MRFEVFRQKLKYISQDTSQDIKEHARVIKMDKRRLKISLAVLDAVKSRFLETQEFIDSTLKEECEKERMTADEVIFYKFKSKKLAWINISVLDLVL